MVHDRETEPNSTIEDPGALTETGIDFEEIRRSLGEHVGEIMGGDALVELCFRDAAELREFDPEGQWESSFLKALIVEGVVASENHLYKILPSDDRL